MQRKIHHYLAFYVVYVLRHSEKYSRHCKQEKELTFNVYYLGAMQATSFKWTNSLKWIFLTRQKNVSSLTMMHGSCHLYTEISVRKSILCLPKLTSDAEAYLEMKLRHAIVLCCVLVFYFTLHTQHLPFVKQSFEVLTALMIFLHSSLTQSFLA